MRYKFGVDGCMLEINDDSFKTSEDMLRKHIAKLKRSRRFVDCGDSSALADNLSLIRECIVKLSETDSHLAFELMIEFIKTSKQSLERCDDSNGDVSSEYIQACTDLGIIALSAKITIDEAVDVVCSLIEYDEFSVCGDIISDFKDILMYCY